MDRMEAFFTEAEAGVSILTACRSASCYLTQEVSGARLSNMYVIEKDSKLHMKTSYGSILTW